MPFRNRFKPHYCAWSDRCGCCRGEAERERGVLVKLCVWRVRSLDRWNKANWAVQCNCSVCVSTSCFVPPRWREWEKKRYRRFECGSFAAFSIPIPRARVGMDEQQRSDGRRDEFPVRFIVTFEMMDRLRMPASFFSSSSLPPLLFFSIEPRPAGWPSAERVRERLPFLLSSPILLCCCAGRYK